MLRKFFLSIAMLVVTAVSLAACGGATADAPTAVATIPPAPNPVVAGEATQIPTSGQPAQTPAPVITEVKPVGDEHITVQHILIGFKDAVGFQGNPPPKAAARTQEEAKKLAYDLLAQAKAGADFDKLVKENSDDQGPGIYSMSNKGVQPTSQQEIPREHMVPAFGNVGFDLKMGEIGIADYDVQTSPYGYHVIKRVPPPPPETKPAGEDDHITVQHILIGFKDAVGFQGNAPQKAQARTEEEAKKLAEDIYSRAKAGEDFDKLVKENSDDSPTGIYQMANKGVQPNAAEGEYPRGQLVPAFGDVAFKLKPGEIGIANYDPTTSPFGWHIIRRLK